MTDTVNIIGAGLAGCEAAYQASKRGCKVKLYDMKPSRMSEAHKSADFAELVCSNSLKSDEVTSSGGLLKAEMRLLDSLILKIAAECKVDAGGALAVDRELFSAKITAFVRNDPGIQVIEQEITDLNFSDTTIVSTGPLTGGALYAALSAECGGFLSFFDASAPIVAFDSLDMERCFFGARYGKGSDYINCPLEKDEYSEFVTSLISADTFI